MADCIDHEEQDAIEADAELGGFAGAIIGEVELGEDDDGLVFLALVTSNGILRIAADDEGELCFSVEQPN